MKLNLENFKNISILLLLIYIIYINSCTNISGGEDSSIRDTISHTTTTTIDIDSTDSSPDTISITSTSSDIEYKYITTEVHDTVEVHDTIFVDRSTGVTVESSTVYEDSLLWAEVKAYSKTPVDSFKYEYKPKFPIYITKTITNNTETVLEEEAKWQVFVGAIVSGSANSFGFGPVVHFKSRREQIFTLGYDGLQREIIVAYSVPIRLKRK